MSVILFFIFASCHRPLNIHIHIAHSSEQLQNKAALKVFIFPDFDLLRMTRSAHDMNMYNIYELRYCKSDF